MTTRWLCVWAARNNNNTHKKKHKERRWREELVRWPFCFSRTGRIITKTLRDPCARARAPSPSFLRISSFFSKTLEIKCRFILLWLFLIARRGGGVVFLLSSKRGWWRQVSLFPEVGEHPPFAPFNNISLYMHRGGVSYIIRNGWPLDEKEGGRPGNTSIIPYFVFGFQLERDIDHVCNKSRKEGGRYD